MAAETLGPVAERSSCVLALRASNDRFEGFLLSVVQVSGCALLVEQARQVLAHLVFDIAARIVRQRAALRLLQRLAERLCVAIATVQFPGLLDCCARCGGIAREGVAKLGVVDEVVNLANNLVAEELFTTVDADVAIDDLAKLIELTKSWRGAVTCLLHHVLDEGGRAGVTLRIEPQRPRLLHHVPHEIGVGLRLVADAKFVGRVVGSVLGRLQLVEGRHVLPGLARPNASHRACSGARDTACDSTTQRVVSAFLKSPALARAICSAIDGTLSGTTAHQARECRLCTGEERSTATSEWRHGPDAASHRAHRGCYWRTFLATALQFRFRLHGAVVGAGDVESLTLEPLPRRSEWSGHARHNLIAERDSFCDAAAGHVGEGARAGNAFR
jgi:hypothetical protein